MTTTVAATSRSRRGVVLAALLGLLIAMGLSLTPAAHAAYPSTKFSVSKTGKYDAWGKVVWYNRSIRIMGTYRNWRRGLPYPQLSVHPGRLGFPAGTVPGLIATQYFTVPGDIVAVVGGIQRVGIRLSNRLIRIVERSA
jgi:hypothetical protein